jgi:hypothetical protein
MELIKKKIYLEDHISRSSGSTYGTVTATTFYFNIFLKQDIDDMGSFTNIVYIPESNIPSSQPNYQIITNKLLAIDGSIVFPFMTGGTPTNMPTNISFYYRTVGKTAQDYYTYFNTYNNLFNLFEVKSRTQNRIDDLRSYVGNFTIGLDIENSTYINYLGQSINGSSKVIQLTPKEIYAFDVDQNNKNGLYYENIDDSLAFVTYKVQSFNMTNVVLSAITKEEYLFGITSKPEIKSDLFIDRGTTTLLERELRLSEVKTVNQIERYQNNYFKVTKY